jgi:hypothetical protein
MISGAHIIAIYICRLRRLTISPLPSITHLTSVRFWAL